MIEMKQRPFYTASQLADNRRRHLEEIEKDRISTSPIYNMDEVIYALEENASTIDYVMQDMDVNENYSPQLQAAFDDLMDVLDYLKKLR